MPTATTPQVYKIQFDILPASAVTRKALHPRRDPITNCTTIKKDASGRERRYLVGTSSGPKKDAHKDAMSEKCIKGFQQQSLDKTILLVHPHTDNLIENQIGILDKSAIDQDGEWKTQFRLFDKYDLEDNPEFSKTIVEKANQFWMMVRGEGAYSKPTRISQFSIQGLMREEDVLKTSNGIVIDWIELDAVAAVTKGAYPQNDFLTVEKALTQFIKKGELQDAVVQDQQTRDLYDENLRIDYVFRDRFRDIIESKDSTDQKRERISNLFDEYKQLTMDLFEKYNYEFPDDDNQKSADSTSATGEKMANDSTEDSNQEEKEDAPAGGEGNPSGQNADALNQISQSLEAILAAIQGMQGTAQKANKEDDDKPPESDADEDANKKANKDAGTMEDSEVGSLNEVSKAIAQIKKLPLSEKKKSEMISEIRKASNPNYAVMSEVEDIKKSLNETNNLLKAMAEGFSEIAIGKSITETVKKSQTQGNGAQLGNEKIAETLNETFKGEKQKSEIVTKSSAIGDFNKALRSLKGVR
ncbi:hypothetical protein Lepto782_23475 (plasmid) [Leptospira interrogans serovar Canicola]|uniref:Uncharacterized protein n=1 Tax=Leptospira interrogans serovar Canicola TaxID=211880 RepID=A0AAQ0B0F0_LEPIR|nr:hypothetical protein [Leptospira interrogans]MBE0302184.1 hypothetical protein [Leptospira interrogans serovar Yeoncheon]QOI45141.1 hypothetical protein Lepto782_23475 [Leptospira interrogans serovar Canicola]